jgi:hypothetical protein
VEPNVLDNKDARLEVSSLGVPTQSDETWAMIRLSYGERARRVDEMEIAR